MGTTTIQVDEDVFDGRYVVIATGAKPRKLNISGEEHISTSDQFLELESSPRRITFIGGGYISMEFAHVSLRTNRDVTVLHRGRRLLEGFDPDLVEQLSQKTQHLGVRLIFKRKSRQLKEARSA